MALIQAMTLHNTAHTKKNIALNNLSTYQFYPLQTFANLRFNNSKFSTVQKQDYTYLELVGSGSESGLGSALNNQDIELHISKVILSQTPPRPLPPPPHPQ